MAGQGKYTRYRPVDPPAPMSTGGSSPPALGTSRYSLLKQLFQAADELTDITKIAERANTYLAPNIQETDPILFPGGKVYLDFQNPDPTLSAPNIPEGPFLPDGKDEPGAPSNPYAPNTSSPDPTGAGGTDPVAPYLRTPDDVAPGVQIGTDGTMVPSTTSKDMYEGNKIGGVNKLIPGFRPGRTR